MQASTTGDYVTIDNVDRHTGPGTGETDQGVLRNVLWEGLDKRVREKFDETGLHVDEHAVLLDADDGHFAPTTNLAFILAAMLGVFLLALARPKPERPARASYCGRTRPSNGRGVSCNSAWGFDEHQFDAA